MNRGRHVIVGAGGHGRVLLRMLRKTSAEVAGFVDADPRLKGTSICDVAVLGSDDVLETLGRDVVLVNGLGSVGDLGPRESVYLRGRALGFRFATIVHPSAVVEDGVKLEEGTQVFAGAIVQSGCVIGSNSIVNTGAIIDHDCRIGAHCHIAPGAVLSGAISVGDRTHVGVGATVIQSIRIGSGCIIGAGSVVVEDVEHGLVVIGVPAKRRGSGVLHD